MVEEQSALQKYLFENMWFLLVASNLILFVSYTLWGLWDVMQAQPLK